MARGPSAANGFAWNSPTKKCFGIINASVIDKKQSFWASCIFTSKFYPLQKYTLYGFSKNKNCYHSSQQFPVELYID